MAVIHVDTEQFDTEVLQCSEPVLVDFWATWCGPCKLLSPVIDEIANDYNGKVKVGKVNVDEQPELASAFRVASIPTVVVIKDGKVTNMSVGYRPKEQIEALL